MPVLLLARSAALRRVSPPGGSRPHALPSTPAQARPPPAPPGLGKAAGRPPAGTGRGGRGGSAKDGCSRQWQGAGSVASPAPAPVGCSLPWPRPATLSPSCRRRLRRCSTPGAGPAEGGPPLCGACAHISRRWLRLCSAAVTRVTGELSSPGQRLGSQAHGAFGRLLAHQAQGAQFVSRVS